MLFCIFVKIYHIISHYLLFLIHSHLYPRQSYVVTLPLLFNLISLIFHWISLDVTSHGQTLCLYWIQSRPAYRVDNIYRDTPIEIEMFTTLSRTYFPHSCKTSLFNYSPGWEINLEQENFLSPPTYHTINFCTNIFSKKHLAPLISVNGVGNISLEVSVFKILFKNTSHP